MKRDKIIEELAILLDDMTITNVSSVALTIEREEEYLSNETNADGALKNKKRLVKETYIIDTTDDYYAN